MGILDKFRKPQIDMPAHVIDGTELRNPNAIQSYILKHWLAGGDVEMQMADGTWVANSTPSFSPDVNYRILGTDHYQLELDAASLRGQDAVMPRITRLESDNASAKVQIRQLTEINRNVTLKHNQAQTDLYTANQTIDSLRDQLNRREGSVAPPPSAIPPAVPRASNSGFNRGTLYKSNDGRGFVVVADKAQVFADFGKTYNPAIDPDGKQLVVIRKGDKKPQTFACRTANGFKDKHGATTSNLDLDIHTGVNVTTFHVGTEYTPCGNYIIVAKRKHATHPWIALDAGTGEAVCLNHSNQR